MLKFDLQIIEENIYCLTKIILFIIFISYKYSLLLQK